MNERSGRAGSEQRDEEELEQAERAGGVHRVGSGGSSPPLYLEGGWGLMTT